MGRILRFGCVRVCRAVFGLLVYSPGKAPPHSKPTQPNGSAGAHSNQAVLSSAAPPYSSSVSRPQSSELVHQEIAASLL